MVKAILYDYWRSSAAYRVRIALNLKGVAYEAVTVDLLKGEHRGSANTARNPQGLVPSLEVDGLTLSQSLPILEYLDETRPDPPLLPTDSVARQRVRARAAAIAMEIHPICNMSVARYAAELAGDGFGPPDWMRRFIPPGLAAVEAMVAGDPARDVGAPPGLFECCLIPQLYNAKRWEVDLTPYPTLRALDDALADHPAFAAAHPDAVGPPPGAP